MAQQRIKHDGKDLTLKVEVFLIREGNQYVAYCPALELSSYGNSAKEAKEAFRGAMDIFIDDTTKKGTFEKELLSLGWTLTQSSYEPPRVSVAFLNEMNSHSRAGAVTAINQQIAVPAYA